MYCDHIPIFYFRLLKALLQCLRLKDCFIAEYYFIICLRQPIILYYILR